MENLKDLNKSYLKALDYVLNYQPETRIKFTLDADIVEELVENGFIERIEKEDDYSNVYEVLEIKEEHVEQVKDVVEDRFDDLYPNFGRARLNEIFQEHIGGMFACFDQARNSDDNYVRSTHRVSASLFNELSEAGFGFRRKYLTTSDNIRQQFAFRSYPFDGREKFVVYANTIISSHLEGLSQIEKWAIYVKAIVGSSHIQSNPAEFSPEKIAEVEETPAVNQAQEDDLEFIMEDIKDRLREEIYSLLEKDPFYFSVLEYLKIHSDSEGRIDAGFLEEIGYGKQESIEECLTQLIGAGILLQKGENQFILSEQVREVLSSIEKRTVVVSYPVRTQREAQEILYEIMKDAQDDIKIIDRFFDDDALKLVKTVVPKKEGLSVHVLTSVSNDRKEELLNEYNELINPSRFEIKVVTGEETPHDRFIIVDGEKIWQVGHSINGLGTDFSTIFLHSEEQSHHYRELFDSLWEDGVVLHNSNN